MATATAAQPAPSRAPTPRSIPPRSSSSLPSESGAPGTSKSRTQQAQAPAQPQQSQAQSQSQPQPQSQVHGPLSDKATAFLIRRILCPQHADKGRHTPAPIEELLPPLTSRNDVDLQLYALIAIILREFVQNWYAKITPDETFVAEIVQIVAHLTRALEQRLRKVDLECLLFDELPDLLDKHVTAYRVAHDPITQPPVRTDPREIYHSLCPLPALSPVPRPGDPESIALQAANEAAYRQLLVHGFLAIMLPTEDVENGCLTALVGQILSELIIGNTVANRLSEPWLIWELLIIASRAVGQKNTTKNTGRLGKSSTGSSNARWRFSVYGLFWTSLQWCFLIVSFVRAAFAVVLTIGSLPPRSGRATSPKQDKISRDGINQGPIMPTTGFADTDLPQPPATPVLAFRLWSAISNLAEMDVRMPWLCGASSMLQWIAVRGPGRIADVNGVLDRLLSNGIQRHVFDAANLPPLLRTVRGSLFPNNMPAGKPTLVAPSSDAELLAVRRKCASALWALVPKGVGRLYFGGGLLRANSVSSLSRRPFATHRGGDEKGQGHGHQSQGPFHHQSGGYAARNDDDATPAAAAENMAIDRDRGRGQDRDRDHQDKDGKRADNNNNSGQDEMVGEYSDEGGDDMGDGEGDSAGQDEAILMEIERGILDVFSDAYCNKHLVYGALELILVRLLPELTEKGALELWAERFSE
ncbi:PXA domain-containing protein [Dichotomopilus funicola]|uniref:PXA domain-containing protein n=1 Tax=Dichotomopilus funicola TaxID=1934379 RepID=A0AAN6V8Z4_9PEZI|nr:PXA domain-containing protein [Dichotomopilus funicola]